MLLRLPPAIACATVLAVATVAAAAPPQAPVTTDGDTVSSAVVDDRGPEDLPARPRATKPSPTDAANPLRPSAASKPAAESKDAAGSTDAVASKDAAGAPAKTDGDGTADAPKKNGCGQAGCTSCVRKVPVCKPKWEDKKTKRPVFTMKCDWECVRPWEPYCQGACCEEKTTPCAGVYTKKRLYKTEEERCERVLKYELEMKPAGDCCNAAPVRDCMGCRILGETVHRLLSHCHH